MYSMAYILTCVETALVVSPFVAETVFLVVQSHDHKHLPWD